MMLEANEEDVVQLLIASPGGRLDGLNVLLEGIRATSAHVVGVSLGEASSAAAILALNCDETVVTNSSEMLIHNVRYGTFGKASDISAHVLHTNKMAERLFRETFAGYLTEQEIVQVLDGREMFLDPDEISQRLQNRDKFHAEQEKILEAEIQKQIEASEAPKPKARRSKRT